MLCNTSPRSPQLDLPRQHLPSTHPGSWPDREEVQIREDGEIEVDHAIFGVTFFVCVKSTEGLNVVSPSLCSPRTGLTCGAGRSTPTTIDGRYCRSVGKNLADLSVGALPPRLSMVVIVGIVAALQPSIPPEASASRRADPGGEAGAGFSIHRVGWSVLS
ncbi:hypothetical protein RRG08_010380 [Elysia crispata]|uniref:Uncharacterized protein n=1 Tax=Elysia crispata TaxID=231223 RepID=A0AAE1BAT2_9GAST|nr:hypothetical protein RRG08_010380 [Elysia crispata]